MKKIIMLLLVLIIVFSTKNVFAQDQYQLTLEKQDGIYFSRRGVNFDDDSYPYYLYKFGNILAYCIEPGKHISTYTYVGSSDYVDLPYSEELKEKLELIGYYGRDYPGHDNIRYSMATQALIWELTGVDTVTFWTKQYEKGEEIDVSKERNEIMNLVNNHKTLPNFKTSYLGYLNKEIIINDTNKVLDNYEVVTKGKEDVYIKDNKLYIIPKAIGTSTITLRRTSYDEYNTIIFVGKGDNSSQKIGRLHFNKEIKTQLNINIKGVSLIVQKVDENNHNIRLANIKFKVKDLTNNKYICPNNNCLYSTDSNGKIIISGLDYGEYEIEEVEDQLIRGYSWNSDKIHITINEKTIFKYNDEIGNYLDLTFKNTSVKGNLEIKKVGEEIIFDNNEFTYQETKMSNISFDIYTIDNKYVKTVTTDQEGYARVHDLEIGEYYLIEKTKLERYLEKDKIMFEIKQNNQYQTTINYELEIKNVLKKGKLEFSKIDSITNQGIPNTIIEIYDENNKLLLTRKTDANGQVIIDNLSIGKYYIKEKEANYYYAKTSELIYFEIKEDDEVVKTIMKNEKILGSLEIEKLGENYRIINEEMDYENIPLANIEFDLFDNEDKLITTLKTNENGYIKYSGLTLGKYYLVEKGKIDNYILNNNRIYFEIKKENNKAIDVKLTINNYLEKGNLEFTKEDLTTSEGIPNTIIEIYDDHNTLWFTKETDLNGKVIVNNLPRGKYYIIEKEANSLYMITNEKVFFEIKENGQIVKAKMTNEKIEIPVYKTNTKENLIANSVFGIIFLVGIGKMYYEKKKSC